MVTSAAAAVANCYVRAVGCIDTARTCAVHWRREIVSAEAISGVRLVQEANDRKDGVFANAGPDMCLYACEEAFFDASASCGEGLRYCWDFDEGDSTQNDAFGKTATHIYRRPGGYVARVTVVDGSGNVSSDSCFVEVLTPPSRGITLVDRFPKGHMGQVYQSGNKFICHLMESAAWYGRVDNCAGKEVTLKVFGFGKHVPPPPSVTTAVNDRTFSKWFKAVYAHSFLEGEWKVLDHASYRYDAVRECMEITFKPEQDPFYVGWSVIYTPQHLRRSLGKIYLTDCVVVERVGNSVEDRPIYLVTIAEKGATRGEKPAVWIVAQQHGYEMGGGHICEGVIDFLISDDPLAQEAKRELVWKIVPMVNPDATSRPWFRYNARGIDLNRNWDAFDNGSGHDAECPEPEVQAVKDAIVEWIRGGGKIAVGLDIHNYPASVSGVELLIPPGPHTQREFSQSFIKQVSPEKFPYGVAKANNANDPGTFCNWILSTAEGCCAFTLEVALGGFGPRRDPRKYTAVPKNLAAVGEFLVRAICAAYRASRR